MSGTQPQACADSHGIGGHESVGELALESSHCLHTRSGVQVFCCEALAGVLIDEPDEFDVVQLLRCGIHVWGKGDT